MSNLGLLVAMTKVQLALRTSDTFLSFPVFSPLSFPAGKLRFTGPVIDRQALADFSRLVNLLPQDPTYVPNNQNYFWDYYNSILTRMQLAVGSASAAEVAQYEQAEALLRIPGNSFASESPTLLDYMQYRDAWRQATVAYEVARATEENSTDPAVRQRWQTIDGPALRGAVFQAVADWDTKGFRQQVEAALQVELSFHAPAMVWQTWRKAFNLDLDAERDGFGQPFIPTSYAPANALDDTWPTCRLNADEIKQLTNQSSPQLRNFLAPDGQPQNLTSVSFEFRLVTLVRPWFRQEVFDARFWRLPPSEPPVCDGGSPAGGSWPALITAVMFARNFSETVQGPPLPPLPPKPGCVLFPTRPDERVRICPVADLKLTLPRARLDAATFNLANTVALPPAAPEQPVSILAFVCKRLPKCPNPDPTIM